MPKNLSDYEYPLFTDDFEGMTPKNEGGDLPTPTQADAGKAIVVNNSGEYALDNVGGVTVVTFENSLDSPDEYTSNMTVREMVDAAPNGIIGVRLQHTARGDNYFQMYPVAVSDFYRVCDISGGIRVERLIRPIGNTKWHFSYVDYSLTPST